MMGVLHVHPNDEGTGGTQIASNLNSRLARKPGVESQLVVGNKMTDSDRVSEFPNLPGERYFNFALERVLSLEGLGSPSSLYFRKIVRDFQPDVIHYHVIHGRYFNMCNIELIPDDIQMVWTLHDMWPFTGNCVYSYGCDRYQRSCGSCPELDSYPRLQFDTTRLLRWIKEKLFDRENTTFVGNCDWILEKAKQSRMNSVGLRRIYNGIDTTQYEPHEESEARDTLQIGPETTVLLFIAGDLNSRRKGLDFLLDAIEQFERPDDLLLLAIGEGSISDDRLPQGVDLLTPGFVSPERMPAVYSAADICVVPSLAETFPLVSLESMACGTPVIAFDSGGLGEQITPEVGWLVERKDVSRLATALGDAVGNGTDLGRLGENARRRVETTYSLDGMVDEYERLYESIVTDTN